MPLLGALIGLVLVLGGGAAGAGPQNTIQVDLDRELPGASVGVANTPGQTCGVAPDPGEAVDVYLIDQLRQVVNAVRTDVAADGSWRLADGLEVPEGAAPGPHTIEAICDPDQGGFAYTPVAFTVLIDLAPPTTTGPTTTVPTAPGTGDAEAGPVLRPAEPSITPKADITGLLIGGVVLWLATVALGWWLTGVISGGGPEAQRGVRVVGWVLMGGAVLFTLSWIVGDLVQDRYRTRDSFISALATPGADHAWIMTLGYLIAGFAVLLMAFVGHVLLRRRHQWLVPVAWWFGLIATMITALGVLRSDCSRTDPTCVATPRSWHHEWHSVIGWLVVVTLIVGVFWAAAVLMRRPQCHQLGLWALGLGFPMLTGLLFLTGAFDEAGLLQRLLLLAAALFFARVGWHLHGADDLDLDPDVNVERTGRGGRI